MKKNTKSRHLPLRSIFAFRPLGTSARHPPLVFSELSYHNYDTTFRQLLQGGSCSKAQSLALKSSPSCSSCSKDSLNAWHPVGCDGWWSVPGLVGLENPTPVTGPSKLAAVFGLLTIHDLGTTWMICIDM